MSVKSWIGTAMMLGILGLGFEIPAPTLAEKVPGVNFSLMRKSESVSE